HAGRCCCAFVYLPTNYLGCPDTGPGLASLLEGRLRGDQYGAAGRNERGQDRGRGVVNGLRGSPLRRSGRGRREEKGRTPPGSDRLRRQASRDGVEAYPRRALQQQRNGQGVIETAAGPIHFERGQGQQGRAWDCSLVLAKYLDQRPEEVRGKRVLELGCGVGLPGVAAAVVGATE
ncbi:unnamed protein product, partial [Ectocarpus sp. 4 AP-2014]